MVGLVLLLFTELLIVCCCIEFSSLLDFGSDTPLLAPASQIIVDHEILY